MDDYTIFRGDTHASSIKFLQDRIAYNQSQTGGVFSSMKPILQPKQGGKEYLAMAQVKNSKHYEGGQGRNHGHHYLQTQASSPMKKFENFMQEHLRMTQGINVRMNKATEDTSPSLLNRVNQRESNESLSKYYTGSPLLQKT